MPILFVVLLTWALPAEAKVNPVCLKAVAGLWNPNEPEAKEIQNVLNWIDVRLLQTAEYPHGVLSMPEFKQFLEKRGVDWKEVKPEDEPSFIARFYFEQWQKWDDVNRAQRDAYLKLELDKLSPVKRQRPGVLEFGGGYSKLKELSAKNSARMLAELKAKYPDYSKASAGNLALAEKFSKQLRFNYLQPGQSGLMGAAPLVSPNALKKLDLGLLNPFYSSLAGGSNMVGFELIGTLEGNLPHVQDDDHARDALRLNDAFALANGMMLPRVRDPIELYDFVAGTDPATAQKFFEKSRDLIPATVTNLEQFREYLKTATMDYIFPQDKQYDRLYLLRTRLIDFVMTAEDGEAFLREAFRIYLANLSVVREVGFLLQVEELDEVGGFQSIFQMELLPFIGWDRGVALQIPVSVPSAEVPKIRVEAWP